MSSVKSPFKRVKVKKKRKSDIESLFKDIKNRSIEIRDLYAHQADILREYQTSFVHSEDVGIELPTGSGKTLVGLLIGEWKRTNLNQRVLYLCPTRQLAYQVNKQSNDYGIDTRVFVGSKYAYNKIDENLYRSGDTIAISTYSGLFNVSPGIKDPQTIILDDAHGAETYISSMWSLNIKRKDHGEIYSNIVELFERELPSHFVGVIYRGNRDHITYKVEKVPFGAFNRGLPGLRSILDSISREDGDELFYRWSAIRDGLHACHIYISYDNILIRPYIPPTLTHTPFSGAEQRIYMSATLGRGGELERITGIRKIERISTPKTYESRGIGRRFYIFPDYSQNIQEYSDWIAQRVSATNRTLVLCPTRYYTNRFLRIVDKCSRKPVVLQARDIEGSMDTFTASEHSILLLTRYDGIDLPHGICRQVIIYGLPSGTNLQETFLDERLGLDVLLRERIKSRIQQASGRCTRSDTDTAAIIMMDRKLLEFCVRIENQNILHPEIRAEMRFSFDQYKNPDFNIDAMLESFMNKDEFWREAEENIMELRGNEELPDTSVTDILDKTVKFEVDYSYAIWKSDFKSALENGKSVSDALPGKKLSPYRALWYYFTAAAAYSQSKFDSEYQRIADEYIIRAKNACYTVSWFPYALRSMLPENESIDSVTEMHVLAAEGLLNTLVKLGSVGSLFSERMDEIERNLDDNDPVKFDTGLVQLGELLGFTSYRSTESAAPDAIWHIENHLLLLFEGKSDESPDSGISVRTCNQTSGHLKWVTNNDNLKQIEEKYCILVSPRSKIDKLAVPYGEDVHYRHISEVMELFKRTKKMLVELRSTMTKEIPDTYRERVLSSMDRWNLTPEKIREFVTSKCVTDLQMT